MGLSTHIKGIEPGDSPEFKKAYAAWKACVAADVEPPEELMEKLLGDDDDEPDPAGRHVSIGAAVHEWSDQDACCDHIDVDIRKLPPGVKIIRFTNSF